MRKDSAEHLNDALASVAEAMQSSLDPSDPIAQMDLERRKGLQKVFLIIYESIHSAIGLSRSEGVIHESLSEVEYLELKAIHNGTGKVSSRIGRAYRDQETLAEKGYIFDAASPGEKHRNYVLTQKGLDFLR
jgi:hypothetical protein